MQVDRLCQHFIRQQDLPSAFQTVFQTIYKALAKRIHDTYVHGQHNHGCAKQAPHSPLQISISGAQGTGKTTLVSGLKFLLEQCYGLRVVAFSLDDFYLPREQRARLAATVHPLLLTRGVPGTHDLVLLEETLLSLRNGDDCLIPRFDKQSDEPLRQADWQVITAPAEVILFEGWCNDAPWQEASELVEPVNDLERLEDKEGIWRHFVNECLIDYHRRVYDKSEVTIMLNCQTFDRVFEWRRLQEEKLFSRTDKIRQKMTDLQIKRFIAHFQRITCSSLQKLPGLVDYELPMAADHSIKDIIVHQRWLS